MNDIITNCENARFLGYSIDTNAAIFLADYNNKPTIIRVKAKEITDLDIKIISDISQVFSNDRFHKYICDIETTCEISVTYPALENEISRNLTKKTRYIETAETYRTVILPKIINLDLSWMENVFNHKAETENIIAENENFVLVPDIKWNKQDQALLYYQCLFKDRKLKSIRDLTAENLSMLQDTYRLCMLAMEKKYNVPEKELRAYFHYIPTHWQLHIHINKISKKWGAAGIDHAYSFHSIVTNLAIKSTYYQEADLEVVDIEWKN